MINILVKIWSGQDNKLRHFKLLEVFSTVPVLLTPAVGLWDLLAHLVRITKIGHLAKIGHSAKNTPFW